MISGLPLLEMIPFVLSYHLSVRWCSVVHPDLNCEVSYLTTDFSFLRVSYLLQIVWYLKAVDCSIGSVCCLYWALVPIFWDGIKWIKRNWLLLIRYITSTVITFELSHKAVLSLTQLLEQLILLLLNFVCKLVLSFYIQAYIPFTCLIYCIALFLCFSRNTKWKVYTGVYDAIGWFQLVWLTVCGTNVITVFNSPNTLKSNFQFLM